MEVDKIAINDNFSSENQKTISEGSVNEQDAHLFKKHVTDAPKDELSSSVSDDSEESMQNFSNLFQKLKLSDEKEHSSSQQNDEDAQSDQPNTSFFKEIKKDTITKDKDFNTSFVQKTDLKKVTGDNSYQNSTKDIEKIFSMDKSWMQSSSKDYSSLNKDLKKQSKTDISLINDKVRIVNEVEQVVYKKDVSNITESELTEVLPIAASTTTTVESLGTNVSTNIDFKTSETTKLQANSTTIAQQIKDQIVDRILVSTASLNANQSVKVVFSPTVLAETEVNIQKLGQVLQVQFVSSDVKSVAFIQSNQMDLQGYLQNNLKQFEDIQVSLKEMDNDLDQPRDGRSRNRNEYQSFEEDDDEQ